MRVYYLTTIMYITKPKIIKKKTFKIYFIFCSRTMTAFYSIQFTVITSKIRVNQMPRYYQANLLFHRNNTHLGHVFWYIHTVFIVLAFVKVQNINVFIHVFVKCVFFSLALNNEIAKILICKSLLRYQSHTEWWSKCKMSAVAWTICLSLDHLRVVETMSSLP